MAPPPVPKWLVLVVEDAPDVRALVVRALSLDYDVIATENGSQALSRLGERPLPALIISDIMMPDLDGLQLAAKVKANAETAHVPIIFLTSRGTPKDIIAGIKAGARHYIPKPFRVTELLEKVARVLPKPGTARKRPVRP